MTTAESIVLAVLASEIVWLEWRVRKFQNELTVSNQKNSHLQILQDVHNLTDAALAAELTSDIGPIDSESASVPDASPSANPKP